MGSFENLNRCREQEKNEFKIHFVVFVGF